MIYKFKIENILNYLFVIYAFLIPLSRAGIAIFALLLPILWFFSKDLKSYIRDIKNSKVMIYLFLYLLLAFISISWSLDSMGGLYYFRKYIYLIPLFVIATTLKEKYITYIISSFLLGMLVSELFSYSIFFELFHYKNILPTNPTPFMHHIPYSMFLAFTSLLILNRVFFSKNIKLKIVLLIYFILVTSNLFINSGRTGEVAFILTLMIILYINIKNKIISFITIIFLTTTIIFVAYNISPIFKIRVESAKIEVNKLIDNNDYCSSWGRRVGGLIVAKEIISDKVFLGTGLSYDMVYLKKYIDNNSSIFPNYRYNSQCVRTLYHYHNYYIQSTVRLGFVGLFIFLMIFYSIFKLDIKDKEIKNILIIFLSIFIISNLFDNLFHSQFGESLFALFIGLFLAQHRVEKGIK